jgi:hypothetical protein
VPRSVIPDQACPGGAGSSKGAFELHLEQSDPKSMRTQKDEVGPLERRNHKVPESPFAEQRQEYDLVHDSAVQL